MASIFSTQNLQTFLRRKYLRPPGPPSRPPPGPPGRDGRRSPRSGRSPPEDDSDDDLVSSAMLLLKVSRWSLVVSLLPSVRVGQRPKANHQRRFYAVAAGASPAGSEGGAGAAALRFASLIAR